MVSLNKVFLIGNLTRNPELRYTPQGSAICDFRIAVNRRYKTSDGVEKDEVSFIDINTWSRQAETCNRFLQKGSQVCVEGRLKMDSWTDKESGKNRTRLFVVAERVQFMGSPSKSHGDGQGEGQHPSSSPQQQKPSPPDNRADTVQNPPPQMPDGAFEVDTETDDDIPF